MPIEPTKSIWMNGEMIPWEDAQIHVLTHTLHYGTGVFEGIRAYETSNGPAIFRLREHMDRMLNSAKILLMPLPYTSEELQDAAKQVVRDSGLDSCYVRPIAYYGYGEMGLATSSCTVDVAIACWPWGAYLGDAGITNGVNITISPWKRLSLESFPSSAKASGQYMNSMLAVQDARKNGFDEALLLNQNDFIAEGSGQNIFIVKDDIIYTNDEESSILMGITRESIIKICEDLNKKVVITNLTKNMLFNADEAFFTGTAAEVTPIRELDDRSIGNGSRGPITEILQKKFFYLI